MGTMLPYHLWQHLKLYAEQRTNSYPSALLSKRPRVVTRPDVE